MSVSSATVRTPCGGAQRHHRRGQVTRRLGRFMNAPVPTFTSSTSADEPSAIFLLMIDEAISGIDSTVAGDVPQGVELAVGRRQPVPGRAHHRADVVELSDEFPRPDLRPPPRDRLQLVQRAAGVAESAAGQLRHRDAARGHQRRQRQSDLVADPAGRVLVRGGPGDRRQVEPLARGDHRRGPPGELAPGSGHAGRPPWPAPPSAPRPRRRGCRRRSPNRSDRRSARRRRVWLRMTSTASKASLTGRSSSGAAEVLAAERQRQYSIIAFTPSAVSTSRSGPPCSQSSCRHRPQGISTSPRKSTQANATSRPPPLRVQRRTSPHSAHSPSPYEAFSTLQPTTTRPSSTRAAAPTGNCGVRRVRRPMASRAARRSGGPVDRSFSSSLVMLN